MSLSEEQRVELTELARAARRYPLMDPRRLRLNELIDIMLDAIDPANVHFDEDVNGG